MGNAGKDTFWRQASAVFHKRAEEYDQWFDNSLLFDIELAALQDLQTVLAGTKLEIGVGPGRFARELGVSYGIDPALAPLGIAKKRGILPCNGVGESLPVRSGCLGTVYILFALCFMAEPLKVLAECKRVLTKGGKIVLGTVNGPSSWGKMLQAKKEKNHPFYSHATFYDSDTIMGWLEDHNCKVVESRSSLLQPPDGLESLEHSLPGVIPEAGFVIFVAEK